MQKLLIFSAKMASSARKESYGSYTHADSVMTPKKGQKAYRLCARGTTDKSQLNFNDEYRDEAQSPAGDCEVK